MGSAPWHQVTAGLPATRGMTRSVLAAGGGAGGTFYAANNHGIFRSPDHGASWQHLDIPWPERYRTQCVQALLVDDRA